MHADYTDQGFDQLLDVIDKIKNKPDERHIVLSSWNPSDLKLMAFPPCHMFAQVWYMLILFIIFPDFMVVICLFAYFYIVVLCSQWGAILSNVSEHC